MKTVCWLCEKPMPYETESGVGTCDECSKPSPAPIPTVEPEPTIPTRYRRIKVWLHEVPVQAERIAEAAQGWQALFLRAMESRRVWRRKAKEEGLLMLHYRERLDAIPATMVAKSHHDATVAERDQLRTELAAANSKVELLARDAATSERMLMNKQVDLDDACQAAESMQAELAAAKLAEHNTNQCLRQMERYKDEAVAELTTLRAQHDAEIEAALEFSARCYFYYDEYIKPNEFEYTPKRRKMLTELYRASRAAAAAEQGMRDMGFVEKRAPCTCPMCICESTPGPVATTPREGFAGCDEGEK